MRAAVVTVSDTRPPDEDESGNLLAELLGEDGFDVVRRFVPDVETEIAAALRALAPDVSLILTTGGTGLAPRDVTPEATRTVVGRDVPGIAEAIRADAASRTPHGLLSRGVAGVVGATLVVNLPGSPGGCRDGFAVLRPALGHALRLLSNKATTHRQT